MQKFLARAANYFSLPLDAVTNAVHLEIIGESDLYLENHNGIEEYSDTEVLLRGGERKIQIRGKNLQICAMSETELRLSGQLDSVTFTAR